MSFSFLRLLGLAVHSSSLINIVHECNIKSRLQSKSFKLTKEFVCLFCLAITGIVFWPELFFFFSGPCVYFFTPVSYLYCENG